jgi:hypothetical protein
MKLVILESPYRGAKHEDRSANVEYARRCVRHSLGQGEAPIASHLLYTQPGILLDNHPEEREWGIGAGLAWLPFAEAVVVYQDRGISQGMHRGIVAALKANVRVEYRRINPQPSTGE